MTAEDERARELAGVDDPKGDGSGASGGRAEGGARDKKTKKERKPSLPVVIGDGIDSESDGGALQANGIVRLLSLWGPATPARYLSAQLATGKRLQIQMEPLGTFTPLWGAQDGAYKRLRCGVSTRLSHTLLIDRHCDATGLDPSDRTFTFTVRRDRPNQTAETVYAAFLIALLDEPIDPSWADWLWRRAQAKGEARPLSVWGTVLREAWECDVPRTLRADISAARAGESSYGPLPFPDPEGNAAA